MEFASVFYKRASVLESMACMETLQKNYWSLVSVCGIQLNCPNCMGFEMGRKIAFHTKTL